MNIVKGNWLSNILLMAGGIVLCILFQKDNVLTTVVYILGALFTMTGCINVIIASQSHSKGSKGTFTTVIGWIAGIGGIGLGAAMLLTPHSFTGILVYVFSIGLIFAGLWHFFTLSYAFRPVKFPGWFYFLPLIILVGGVVILCSANIRDNIPVSVIMTGTGLIIFALTSFLENGYVSLIHHREKKAEKQELTATSTATGRGTTGTEPGTAAGLVTPAESVETISEGDHEVTGQ